ncbi:MAG: hypothetical protein RIS87_43 [Pseudomonadota bacterium]
MKRSLGIKSKLQNVVTEVEDNIGGEPQTIEDANAQNARQRGFLCGNDVLKSIETDELEVSDEDSIQTLDIDSFAGADHGNGV